MSPDISVSPMLIATSISAAPQGNTAFSASRPVSENRIILIITIRQVIR